MRGMSPIRQRLQVGAGPRMKVPGSNMPIQYPQTPDDMEYPGGGDLGMEMSEPYQMPAPQGMPNMGAQAMPVHSMPEAEKFYKGMGQAMPEGIRGLTGAMEKAPAGPLRERMHATQHQMMAGDQKAVIQSKRMELARKKQMLEAAYQKIRRGEIMDTDGKLMRQIDGGMQQIDAMLGALGLPTNAE